MANFRLIAVSDDGTEFNLPRTEEIPSWIKKSRSDRGLSMQELGAKLGVSKQAVYLWESGESSPTTDRIIKLMEMFSTPVEQDASSLLLKHASNVKVADK